MSRRLDFTKASRNEQARHGLSVKDEAEWMENDAAAPHAMRHWLTTTRYINDVDHMEWNGI
jgi:hypothetical protein